MQNSIPTTPLQSDVQRAQKQSFAAKENIREFYYGKMGDGVGNTAGSRTGYVKVRLPALKNVVMEVYNARCAEVDDLPIIVGYTPEQPGILQVLSIDLTPSVSEGNNAGQISLGNIPPHHQSHEWRGTGGGNDLVLVQWRQITSLQPFFVNTWVLAIQRGIVPTQNGYLSFAYQELDFDNDYYALSRGYDQTGWGHYVLVYLDREGVLSLKWGESKPLGILSYRDIPYPPPYGGYALCGIRFYNGQTSLVETDVETDLVDLRFPQPNYYNELTEVVDKLGESLLRILHEHF